MAEQPQQQGGGGNKPQQQRPSSGVTILGVRINGFVWMLLVLMCVSWLCQCVGSVADGDWGWLK